MYSTKQKYIIQPNEFHGNCFVWGADVGMYVSPIDALVGWSMMDNIITNPTNYKQRSFDQIFVRPGDVLLYLGTVGDVIFEKSVLLHGETIVIMHSDIFKKHSSLVPVAIE